MERIVLVVLSFLALVTGDDGGQFMLCKPVSKAFEKINETVLPASNCKCDSSPNSHPGKRGARGLQGIQGPPGPPGLADYEQINERLQMELNEIKRQLKCGGGVVVGDLCYRLLYSIGFGVTYDKARSLCIFHGGVLAETPTEEIYNAVYNYVRKTYSKSLDHKDHKFVDVWIGSLHQRGNVILSNGRRSYAPWLRNYPVIESRRTHMGIHVSIDPEDTVSGMFNIWPIALQPVPLCQFTLEDK